MNSRFLVAVILSALILSGCVSSREVSNEEPYRAFVGRTVELHRPMLLVGHGGYFFGSSNEVMSARHAQYGLTDPGTYPSPRVAVKLPAGHPLTIDTVREEVCVDSYLAVMYGHTIFPPTGRRVTFAFLRAPMSYQPRGPLPWELQY